MNRRFLDQLIPPSTDAIAGTLNRADLRDSVLRLAHAIHQRGGGSWLLYEADPFWFIVAFYGTVLGGGTVILLPDDRRATIESLSGQYSGQIGSTTVVANVVTPSELVAAVSAQTTLPDVVTGDIVVLTSGSSGARKRLTRSLDALLGEVRSLQQQWPDGNRCITASMVSSHHLYGLIFAVVWPLYSGSAILSAAMVPVPDFSSLNNTTGYTVRLVTSPSYLHRLESSIGLATFTDQEGRTVIVERVFSAGAPLDPVKARYAAQRLACPIDEIYGSSETGAVATRRADRGEAWRALPGARLSEQETRLVIESPNSAREIATRYVSPDRVTFDQHGFQLLGRTDRIVKVEGKRVSLQVIEDAVRRHHHVMDCSAILDQGDQSRIALVVVLNHDGNAALYDKGKAAIDRTVREILGNDVDTVALPRRIRYLSCIPVDAQGKVRRELLLPAFGEHARRRPTVHAITNSDEWRHIEMALDPDLLSFEGHFRDFAVLPGVALVDWAASIALEQFGIDGAARRLSEVKFTNVLRPNDRLVLAIRYVNGMIEYRYTRMGVLCAKGRVEIDERPN